MAQNKVDLEVKTQSVSGTVRGGETFSYLVTITNTGVEKATEVVLQQTSVMEITSSAASAGDCRKLEESGQLLKPFRCLLGDIKPGEAVSLSFEVKIVDFDDEYPDEAPQMGTAEESEAKVFNKKPLMDFPGKVEKEKISRPGTMPVADIEVYAKEEEENRENNRVELLAKVLPSKNRAPHVQIVSPKDDAVIARPSNKLTKVVFTIKASDPDGTVEKVVVNTGQYSISIEHPENKYIIDGKSYSIKEVEEKREAFQKYFGGEAAKTGKDTYTFTLENPKYGFNRVGVAAYDNGNRVSFAVVNFFVKGDNAIELKTRSNEAIIQPNTDVLLEAVTKLGEGKIEKIELIGNKLCCGQPPLMKQISGSGDSFVHQYVWKNIGKGYYSLQALLTVDSGAFTYSERLEFKVTEKPTVKITSIKNGQIFKQGEDIPIEVEAVDADGKVENVSISVDGKYERDFSWHPGKEHKSGYISYLKKGTYTILAKAADDMEVEAESEPITIIVK